MHDGKDGKLSSLSGLKFETFHKMRNKQIFVEQYDGGIDDSYHLLEGGTVAPKSEQTGFDGKEVQAAFKKQFADQVQNQLHVNEVINF